MDATTRAQAELLAQQMATQATTIDELNQLMKAMMKAALERMLNTELDHHLRNPPIDSLPQAGEPVIDSQATTNTPKTKKNRRNGHSTKTVSGTVGELKITTPRDRDGTFEPLLIPKYHRRLDGFDDKILALYAKGMTTRDIQEIVKDLYDVDVSPTLISDITADLDAEATAWRTRRLDPLFPIVYLDGIVIHLRGENGKVSHHTMYVALGLNVHGKKELLGLWLSESEGAKFWLNCLTDLKNRGVNDIFVVCVDGLSGFAEAIRVAFPLAKVQRCIVHLVRNALKYTNKTDSPEVVKDLKTIYQSATQAEAEAALDAFEAKWGAKYPTIVKQWRQHWPDIISMFDFPEPIRRVMYTTNAIESVNSVIRKYTRNRKQYPNAESALKLVWLAIREASRTWTYSVPKWKEALNYFAVLFEDRMPANLLK